MIRILLLLVLGFVSNASAQNPLRWDKDTVTIRQRGCNILPDTLRATFRNVSNEPSELLDLFGLGKRWTVVNREEALGVVAPGEVVEVILYFKGGPSPLTTNEKLTLKTIDGDSDTLRVITDILVSGLGTKYHDTLKFVFPLGLTNTWLTYIGPSGNIPFVFEDFWVEGDSEISFIRTPLRDTLQGSQRIAVVFTSDRPDTFEATAFMRGTECDSIYTITAILVSDPRSAGKVHWDSYAANLVPRDCETKISEEVVLMNTGTSDAQIESVEIIDDANNSFSITASDPPGRMSNFVLSPGPWEAGIKYKILFDPKGVSKNTYAKLLVRVQGGNNDTISLNGDVQSGSLLVADSMSTKLGKIPRETERTIYPLVANSGRRDFLIKSIDLPSNVQVTLQGLAVDTIIEAASYHRFSATIKSSVVGMINVPIVLHGTTCEDPLTLTLTGEVIDKQSVKNGSISGIEIQQIGHQALIRHDNLSPVPYRLSDGVGRTVARGYARDGDRIEFDRTLVGVYFLFVGSAEQSVMAKFLF